MITATVDALTLLELAAGDCPKAGFFVECLYELVGAAAHIPDRLLRIEDLLRQAEQYDEPDIQHWIRRSRVFLANPDAFERSGWLTGGWAVDNDVWRESPRD